VHEFLDTWEPDVVAIEETIYVQNLRTAQKLGAARGAAIGAASGRGFVVVEYPPLRVKQSVAGFGRASKEQVAGQMRGLLRMEQELSFDEADAAAVAYCHAITLGRRIE
jgi:crossover junction endodeoxyribonuclease RuvC